MSDHYERLGVSFGATREEIRVAYRRLARQHHPDRNGDASAVRMAQINEAWRVLSDPARRAVYDAQSRGRTSQRSSNGHGSNGEPGSARTSGSASSFTATDDRPRHGAAGRVFFEPPATPARFPWRFMLGIAVAGIAFVLVNAALTKQGSERAPDNLMQVGSCVDILGNGDAKEVLCSGPYDGVVADLQPVESMCPQGTELHRDRQGMGNICIRLDSN
ncbi:MAG: J domain-containing protein [Ilumatobacteraceae bacterium]